MSGFPVVIVDKGGVPFKQVTKNAPVATVSTHGGLAITLTTGQAPPLILQGSAPPPPPPPPPPPVIARTSGTGYPGSVYTVTDGGTGIWQTNVTGTWADVAGETAANYTLTGSQAGSSIRWVRADDSELSNSLTTIAHIANGRFNDGVDPWASAGSGVSISAADKTMRIERTGSTVSAWTQILGLVSGVNYRITADQRRISGSVTTHLVLKSGPAISDTTLLAQAQSSSTTWLTGTTLDFTATSASIYLHLFGSAGAGVYEFDNIFIDPLP